MEWDDLKFVLATARSGSFLGAATLLRVTHTTVGRRIKALEADLGQPLFIKTREGCTPTELCQSILPAAKTMEEQVRKIALSADQVVYQPHGLIRIHTAAWIIEHILVPNLPTLIDKYPKLRIGFISDVVESHEDPAVPKVALRFDMMSKRDEVEQELGAVAFSVYKPSDADFDTLPWLSNHGLNVTLRTFEWLKRQNVEEADLKATGTDANLICAMIRAGIGKGLVPDVLGQADPRLTRAHDGPPDLIRTLRLIQTRRAISSPEGNALKDWLLSVFQTNRDVLARPDLGQGAV